MSERGGRPAGGRSILWRMPRSDDGEGRKESERERERREREWAMILTHCLGARQAGLRAAADTNLAIPNLCLCRSILAGTKRGGRRARSRRLSWDFFSTTLARATQSQSVWFEAPQSEEKERRVLESVRRTAAVWPRKGMRIGKRVLNAEQDRIL